MQGKTQGPVVEPFARLRGVPAEQGVKLAFELAAVAVTVVE